METQKLLFQQIKHTIPSHLSLVEEISELLNISNDSAYRRIRGEKSLSLEELLLISKRFDVSVDTLFSLKSENVIFKEIELGPKGIGIKEWLEFILRDMVRIHAAREKEIIYSAKDPPLFHYFQIPEIGAFKTFFWQKTLMQFPEFADRKFRLDDYDPEIQELGMRSLARYIKVPTVELWNVDTFMIAFSQMEYYWVSGLFENSEDFFTLCDKFTLWLIHIQKQAELGFKYLYGEEPHGIEGTFKLYLNEVVRNDNSIYVKMDDVCVSYLTYNVLSLLITSNPDFCHHNEEFLKELCRKSSLISSVNAKERSHFFNKLLQRVEDFKSEVR
jgi:hypothetical protein